MRALPRTTTLAALLAFGVPALTAGCNDATSPRDQVPGTYSLRTINGQSLPFVTGQDASSTSAIASDVFTFKSDGTLTEQTAVLVTPAAGGSPSTQSASHTGTWTFSSNSVAVQFSDGTHVAGVFSGGNTITVSETNATLVYQK